jgi:hypothetical protein
MKWLGHVARIGILRNANEVTIVNCEMKDNLKDMVVDRKTILKIVLNN